MTGVWSAGARLEPRGSMNDISSRNSASWKLGSAQIRQVKPAKKLKRMAQMLREIAMTVKNEIWIFNIFNDTNVTFINRYEGHRDVCMSHILRNYFLDMKRRPETKALASFHFILHNQLHCSSNNLIPLFVSFKKKSRYFKYITVILAI